MLAFKTAINPMTKFQFHNVFNVLTHENVIFCMYLNMDSWEQRELITEVTRKFDSSIRMVNTRLFREYALNCEALEPLIPVLSGRLVCIMNNKDVREIGSLVSETN